MASVMIVDDELIICQLIECLIDREALGIEACFSTTSSEEAYQRALKQRPEILITDINMPVMDGLELIHRLTSAGLTNTTYIIISGYQSFDYAYTAIKYGVTDFLLKPIDRAELNNTLKRIIDKSTVEAYKLKQYQDVRHAAQVSRLSVRKQALLNLTAAHPGSRAATLELLENPEFFLFTAPCFRFGIVRLELFSKAEHLAGKLVPDIARICINALQPECRDMESIVQGNSVLFLINYAREKDETILSCVRAILASALAHVHDYRLSVTIGLSSMLDDSSVIRCAFREANCAVQSRFVIGENRVINASDLDLAPCAPFMGFIARKDAINHALEILDARLLDAELNDLLCDMRAYLKQYPYKAQTLYAQILRETDLLFHAHDERNAQAEKSAPGDCFADCFDLEALEKAYTKAVHAAFDALLSASQVNQNQTIAVIKRYIDAHYTQPLSLEQLAGCVYLSPAYIGILFKKCEGIGFSDYLAQYRIDISKSLLRDTNQSLAQIAGAVGYKDVHYFSKLFVQKVGIKPLEYRKIHSL